MVGLQDIMTLCAKYAPHHKIVFDASKFFGVLFHTLLTKSFERILQLDGKLIEFVNSVKYLGMYLSDKLHGDLGITRQIKYLYAFENKLKLNFFRSSERIKNILFKAHCSSVYACQLWVRYIFQSFR